MCGAKPRAGVDIQPSMMTTTLHETGISGLLTRIRGEFLEMPGLRLTEAQARRLWGLDAASCGALLGALVDAQFLFRTRDGAFMRLEHAVPVKASSARRTNVAAA